MHSRQRTHTSHGWDTVVVFGFSAAISKEVYLEYRHATEELWNMHRALFHRAKKLHACLGKVIDGSNTLVSYDSNTAGGISGGSVFRLDEGGGLTLWGIRVGGSLKNSFNCCVPLHMVRTEFGLD